MPVCKSNLIRQGSSLSQVFSKNISKIQHGNESVWIIPYEREAGNMRGWGKKPQHDVPISHTNVLCLQKGVANYHTGFLDWEFMLERIGTWSIRNYIQGQ